MNNTIFKTQNKQTYLCLFNIMFYISNNSRDQRLKDLKWDGIALKIK